MVYTSVGFSEGEKGEASNVPNLCLAKLRKQQARCQNPVAKNRNRCEIHGGTSTGPRTPEGMERRIAALVAGRARWAANLKAQGKPFPNSRKGRPNLTQEQRTAIAEGKRQRAETRRRYGAQKSELQTLKAKAGIVRTLAPTYMKKADLADSHEMTKVAAAMHVLGDFPGTVEHLDSELAEEATRLHSRAYRALMPAMGTVILESLRREKEREAKEQGELFREMVMRVYRERAEREAQRRRDCSEG
jgi:hypothetical protein